MTDESKPTITGGWSPRSIRLGRWTFAATRAISGEWSRDGVVKRIALIRGRKGTGWHLIAGPWCISAGKASTT